MKLLLHDVLRPRYAEASDSIEMNPKILKLDHGI